MSIFTRNRAKDLQDFSDELRDADSWRIGSINKQYGLEGEPSTFAIEPVRSLLAVGTSNGTIHIFGSPAVAVKLRSGSIPIKFLQFSSSALCKLIGVDARNKLLVWNFEGKPELEATEQYQEMITCIAVPPSHTHAFLGCTGGTVKTYDLSRLCPSPYIIPNAWTIHLQKLKASGVPRPGRMDRSTESMVMDLVPHPRNLNLLLIAYDEGVVLWDITLKTLMGTYELERLDPTSDSSKSFTPTTLAFHPSGEIFAVGYTDGFFAFWAIDEEDQPLGIKNTDEEDLNVALLNQPSKREAIFKMAWSGSSETAEGETTLTILGGINASESTGIITLRLPPLQYVPSTTYSSGLLPHVRQAFKNSLHVLQTYLYATPTAPHDFILIPRSSPHFSNTFDPVAIIITFKRSSKPGKCTKACKFPPPSVNIEAIPNPQPLLPGNEAAPDASTPVSDHPPSTEKVTSPPLSPITDKDTSSPLLEYRLPLPLSSSICGSLVTKIRKQSFERLVSWWAKHGGQDDDEFVPRLPLKGGLAFPDLDGKAAPDPRMIKYESHELLITHHEDLTIRFHDISPHLLVSPGPLDSEYPQFLPHLTIDLRPLLRSDPVWASTSTPIENIIVHQVHFAKESLEFAVALQSGELFFFKFGEARNDVELRDPPEVPATGQELVDLRDFATWYKDGFKPSLFFSPNLGTISCLAQSDIGFVAIAYKRGTLLIIDMRGPSVCFRTGNDAHLVEPHTMTLQWTIAGLAEDATPAPRLIVAHQSGLVKVFTLFQEAGHWNVVESKTIKSGLADPLACFVLDPNSGATCSANPERLKLAMQAGSRSTAEPGIHSLLFGASQTGVRCIANLVGQRLSKTEWPRAVGKIEKVSIVGYSDFRALVAFTSTRNLLVYSIPSLELMHTLTLPAVLNSNPTPRLGMVNCDESGDFTETTLIADFLSITTQSSLFESRQPLLPIVDLRGRPVNPPPPPRKYGSSSSVLGWLMSTVDSSLSGDALDAILAGPNRPPPPPSKASVQTPSTTAGTSKDRQGGGDPFSRLTAAVSERGERLGQLEEQFGQMEAHSKDMLAEAKRIAARESARGWFGF